MYGVYIYIPVSTNTLFLSFQNIQPDKEILVDVLMFLWQRCKTGLQRIQMSGSDYLKYIHKYKAYQVLLYFNVSLNMNAVCYSKAKIKYWYPV